MDPRQHMKSYTTPQLTTLGAVEQLTLDKNKPSSTGVNWVKPGSDNDPGGGGLNRKKSI